MRKLNTIIGILVLSIIFSGCLMNNDDGNKVKNIKMTIYPETGYAGYIMSEDTYGEFLVFSINKNKEKKLLTSGNKSFNNFEYKKGYKYILKAKKIWLSNPPQDASSIRYDFVKVLSKQKVITQNREQTIEIKVSSKKVKLIPLSSHKIQSALNIKEKGTNNWRPLTHIQGFDFQKGYAYTLKVKKMIQAKPYNVKYILLDILSKEKNTK